MKRYSNLFVSILCQRRRLSMHLVFATLTAIGLVSITSGISRASEPMPLTDAQLDGITAGFLELNAVANATALGRDTLTTTFTDTVVVQGVPQEDGYVYTQGSAIADALAVGESAITSTSVGFTTDEEVVSVQYENRVETSIVGYVKPKDKKAWNQRKKREASKDKKAWNQRKLKKDKKAWNQAKRTKDKKAWNRKKSPQQRTPKRSVKNDPDIKAWHKKRHKRSGSKTRKNDPNKKAWHNKPRKHLRKNDPNKKAWRKKPIIQQRETSTLVVVTRVGVASP